MVRIKIFLAIVTYPVFFFYGQPEQGKIACPLFHWHIKYIEDITRWREDMNFIFECQNNILRASAASE